MPWRWGGVLRKGSFDETGNFSFGVEEHTDFPGMKYEPRSGSSAWTSRWPSSARDTGGSEEGRQAKMASKHRVTRYDAMEYVKIKYGVDIVEAA